PPPAQRPPPVPKLSLGAAGYAQAQQFQAARSTWERTLGASAAATLASSDLASWKLAADGVAAFVKVADSLLLSIDESGPLLTELRRATIHGALLPDRPDLLRIQL